MYDLSKFNDPQREAIMHDKGPLLILAGAGSGKTGVLTNRIAFLIKEREVSPYSILAITFTNKAAEEMKTRVNNLLGGDYNGVWVSTFHSMCVKMLRKYIEHIGYSRNFSIYDTDDCKTLMKGICKRFNIDTKKIKEKVFLNAISDAKNQLITPEEYERTAYDYSSKKIAEVYKEYQKELKDNNALDFDDLLMKTVELFTVCGEALDYYTNRFKYVMVDEYQDTNHAQFVLVKMLAAHMNENGIVERNLCVVGDDDQSIYSFRGADITNILSFEKTYKDAKVIKLEQNYRSTGNILNVANEIISHNKGRKSKKLWTADSDGSQVIFTQYNSDIDEAKAVISDINDKIKAGKSFNSFAILYRTNAQSRIFEERMVFSNIPYKLVGGVNFYQRKEIKDILGYLKTIANGNDSLMVKRIINVPKRGLGDTTLEKIQTYANEYGITFYEALERNAFIDSINAKTKGKLQDFVDFINNYREKSKEIPASKLMKELIDDISYDDVIIDYCDGEKDKIEDKQNNIDSLIDKALSFELDNEGATLDDFLAEVALVADLDSVNDEEEHVLLMTIHAAKGLEFDNVYLVGMEENLFPSGLSTEEIEIEEERRLCYVAITRARKELMISAAKQRMMHGQFTSNPISRFIVREVPREMIQIKGHAHEGYLREERRINNENSNSPIFTDRVLGDLPSAKHEYSKIAKSNPYVSPYKTREITPPTNTSLPYTEGDTVKHVRFGVGTVISIVKGSKDYEVTVDFNGQTKKMLASFAKLTKV